jgi:quinol-cytochrome oxidoreductase complex cytochrome b subunit
MLLVAAILFPAPLAAPLKQLTAAVGDARAPWFFLWVQQMLEWGDPFLWGILAPAMLLIVFALIPYIFPQPDDADLGRWFPRSNRLARYVAGGMFLSILALTLWALRSTNGF